MHTVPLQLQEHLFDFAYMYVYIVRVLHSDDALPVSIWLPSTNIVTSHRIHTFIRYIRFATTVSSHAFTYARADMYMKLHDHTVCNGSDEYVCEHRDVHMHTHTFDDSSMHAGNTLHYLFLNIVYMRIILISGCIQASDDTQLMIDRTREAFASFFQTVIWTNIQCQHTRYPLRTLCA